jgi:signal peptidase I
MFDFPKKKQLAFGVVDADDDCDIEVHKMKRVSGPSLWVEGAKLFRDIVLVLSVFALFLVFIAQPVVVDGSSMVPTLHQNERLIVNKLVYYKFTSFSWGHIQRGDVVVFWYPKEPDKSYVKRVIGLPGETVEVRNGRVFINDVLLQESYIEKSVNQAGSNFKAKEVEEHYYYVMGDNRDNSSDSRYWGMVPEKYIYGKVFFRYWSPMNAGFIRQGEFQLDSIEDDDDRAKAVETDTK